MANAPPVPPPAAPAPIVVTVVAAPITSTLHATFLANEGLVLATPYLPWEAVPPVAGAPARVRLSQRILLYAFVMRCRLSTTANSLAFFDSTHILNFALSGAAWGRVLTELVASGLLSAPIADLPALFGSLRDLSIVNAANLTLFPADSIQGEDFSIAGVPGVAGVAAQPAVAQVGRRGAVNFVPGRRAVPAVAAVAAIPPIVGPTELEPLVHLSLSTVQDTSLSAPLEPLSQLALFFGDHLTRASRTAAGAPARLAMGILRPNLERRIFGAVGQPAEAVAVEIPRFLAGLELPTLWHAPSFDASLTRRTLSDTLRYQYGSAEDRRAVETSRLGYATG